MNLHLRHSYSAFTRLLLLAALFAAVLPSYAAAQSQQTASASFPTLQSRAEQGDAVAQYNLAQSYLRHDPTHDPTNEDYQSALKRLRAFARQPFQDPPRLKTVWEFLTTKVWASRSITRKPPGGCGLPR